MDQPATPERNGAPNLLEMVGGPIGILESSLPAVAFVAAYSISGSDTETSVAVAVGFALLIAAARLVRREKPWYALSGLVGVAIAAFVATRSGKAENFFLPGLLSNAGYAAACLISIAARYPLIGVIVGQIDGEGLAWRDDPRRMRVFRNATFMWAGLFILRLVVQTPLYLAKEVVALGVVKTAMGLPLFALAAWLTYLMVRRSNAAAATDP